jgi:hypothetical protein
MVILWITILGLSIMGISLICGKGTWMISGYNTMSKEEKANCDIKKVSHAVGIFLLIIGVLMGMMNFVTQYAVKNDVKNIIGYAGVFFAFVVVVGSIILIVICQKYDKK